MSIIVGVVIPAILFIITLPLQSFLFVLRQGLKVREIQLKGKSKGSLERKLGFSGGSDTLRLRLGLSESSSKYKRSNLGIKSEQMSLKAMRLLLKCISQLIVLLRSVASTLIGIVLSTIVMLGPIAIALVLGISSIILYMGEPNKVSYSSLVSSQDTNKTSTKSSTVSKDVKEIIDMSDSECWKLASEGKYSSYDEVNKACQANFEKEKKFWTDLLKDVKVPVWVWTDSKKTKKKSSTRVIKVNKYFAEYWKSFMTDLYNCNEKYVIYEAGGFSFRYKNNGSGMKNMSAHSFGLVLDINTATKGMGSNAAGIGDGTPWNSDKGLSEPYKSEACAFTGSWFNLVKKYRLDWGGLWTAGSLDPMHFSVVGDRNRDTRDYKPSTSGQSPK